MNCWQYAVVAVEKMQCRRRDKWKSDILPSLGHMDTKVLFGNFSGQEVNVTKGVRIGSDGSGKCVS